MLDNVLSDTTAETPSDSMAARELVGKLLDQLSPADRTVIQMLDLEQKSVAEISALTGWGQSMIKVRAFRARRKLQKLFQELRNQEKS